MHLIDALPDGYRSVSLHPRQTSKVLCPGKRTATLSWRARPNQPVLTFGQVLNQLAKYFWRNILTYGQFRVDTTRLAKTIYETCVCSESCICVFDLISYLQSMHQFYVQVKGVEKCLHELDKQKFIS